MRKLWRELKLVTFWDTWRLLPLEVRESFNRRGWAAFIDWPVFSDHFASFLTGKPIDLAEDIGFIRGSATRANGCVHCIQIPFWEQTSSISHSSSVCYWLVAKWRCERLVRLYRVFTSFWIEKICVIVFIKVQTILGLQCFKKFRRNLIIVKTS